MKRQRTITIGEMRTGWFVRYLQWGVPHGFCVHWKGRQHPFDPCEFFSWRQVVRAIDVRLGMAGLKRSYPDGASSPDGAITRVKTEFWERLQVTVERLAAKGLVCDPTAANGGARHGTSP